MKRYFLLFVVSIISILNHGCQNTNQIPLKDLVNEMDKPNSPGGYIAIFKDGNTVFSEGFGLSDLNQREKFTSETIFPIASMTKHITSICLLKLVEKDMISLDQNILEFFPEFEGFAKNIAVSDLLNHTSGIASWPAAATMRGEQIHKFEKTPTEFLIDHNQLVFEPGTEFKYNNTPYFLAGEIIRKITGKTLPEFANEEFFSKLGMDNTNYRIYSKDQLSDAAKGYVLNSDGIWEERLSKAKYIGPVGVYTTISDFKKWDHAIQNKMVLEPNLLKLLRTSYVLNNDKKTNYGYGQYISNLKGIEKEYHGGTDYDFGYKSYYARFPEHRLTYVLFSNNSELNRAQTIKSIEQYILKNFLLDDLPKSNNSNLEKTVNSTVNLPNSEPFIKSKIELDKYVGSYYSKTIDATYVLKINEDGNLQLNVGEIDPLILKWINQNEARTSFYSIRGRRLSAYGPTFKFVDHENNITGFLLDAVGVNNISFMKL